MTKGCTLESGGGRSYRVGVNVGCHWTEARYAQEHGCATIPALPLGAKFEAQSTSRQDFNPEALRAAAPYRREDLVRKERGVAARHLFTHGDPGEEPMHCLATMNALAFGNKRADEPRVQAYLWQGRAKLDARVPRSAQAGELTATKLAAWAHAEAEGCSRSLYQTTSQAAACSAALQAASQPVGRCASTRPPACGAGRKPKGPHVSELDKTYHKTGLRAGGTITKGPFAGSTY